MQGIGAGPAAGAAMAAVNVSSAARRLTSQSQGHEANGHGIHAQPDGAGPSPGRSTASGGSPPATGALSASATVYPEPEPYVSTFGSLPSQLAGSSEKASGWGKERAAAACRHVGMTSIMSRHAAAPCSAAPTCNPWLPLLGKFAPQPRRALQLNRILLTHAPYLSKLESLASSATRRVLA